MSSNTAPRSVEDFQDRLAELAGGLPKRMRQTAEYLAANTDRIAVSTVADLAYAADVQPSALIRFCQLMGFSGFSDMQRLFRQNYNGTWPDYRTRLKNLRETGAETPSGLLAEFVDVGIKSLENLASMVDPRALDEAVRLISEARTIHLIGLRRAFPVASYLAYAFEKMEMPAMLHARTANFDQRHAVQEGDVLIAITFAPYGAATVELAADCHERGIPVVAITDTAMSPLRQLNLVFLSSPDVDYGAFRTLSATLSLATSLAVAAGTRRDRALMLS